MKAITCGCTLFRMGEFLHYGQRKSCEHAQWLLCIAGEDLSAGSFVRCANPIQYQVYRNTPPAKPFGWVTSDVMAGRLFFLMLLGEQLEKDREHLEKCWLLGMEGRDVL